MVITTEDNIHNLQYKTKSTDVHIKLKGYIMVNKEGYLAVIMRLYNITMLQLIAS